MKLKKILAAATAAAMAFSLLVVPQSVSAAGETTTYATLVTGIAYGTSANKAGTLGSEIIGDDQHGYKDTVAFAGLYEPAEVDPDSFAVTLSTATALADVVALNDDIDVSYNATTGKLTFSLLVEEEDSPTVPTDVYVNYEFTVTWKDKEQDYKDLPIVVEYIVVPMVEDDDDTDEDESVDQITIAVDAVIENGNDVDGYSGVAAFANVKEPAELETEDFDVSVFHIASGDEFASFDVDDTTIDFDDGVLTFTVTDGTNEIEYTLDVTWKQPKTGGLIGFSNGSTGGGSAAVNPNNVPKPDTTGSSSNGGRSSSSSSATTGSTVSATSGMTNATYTQGGAIPGALVAKAKELNNAKLSAQITITQPNAAGTLGLKLDPKYAGMNVKLYKQTSDTQIKLVAKAVVSETGTVGFSGVTETGSYVIVVY